MSSIFDKKDIIGIYEVNTETFASDIETANSVFKVRFVKASNSVSSFVSAKFCIMTAEDVKIFVGVYKDTNNEEFTLIQIPLLGQSIQELVFDINKYQDTQAEVVNSSGYISSLQLQDTGLTSNSSVWLYFDVATKQINSTYRNLQKDLKYFLTSAEPYAEQNNSVQSLGGYVSKSEIYKVFSLSAPVSIYDSIISVSETSLSDNFSLVDLQKLEYLQINDEIVRVSKWSGLNAYLSERNVFDTGLRMHASGDLVREIKYNYFFDRNLSADYKQYRCLALKNDSETETIKNLRIFLNTPSRNNLSQIRIAIEEPKSNYYNSESSSNGVTAFAVNSLINAYPNDYFVDAPIIFQSGPNENQIRFVKSYIASSGTIVIDKRLPVNIAIGDKFFIDTAPAFRNKSAVKIPTGANISEFINPLQSLDGVSIGISQRVDGGDLLPKQVIYIWLERSILEINDEYYGNRFSLSAIYSRV